MRPILSIHALSRAIRARSPDSVTAGDARALLRAYVGDDWWDWEQACRRHVVTDHTRPQPLVVAYPQWYRLRILHWAQGTSLPWHDHPGMLTVGMRVLRGHLEEDVLLRGDTTVRRYIRRPGKDPISILAEADRHVVKAKEHTTSLHLDVASVTS